MICSLTPVQHIDTCLRVWHISDVMYTECQKCGYQFVKSDSKTINNIGKNIYINGHIFGVETKGKPQSTNQAEKWYDINIYQWKSFMVNRYYPQNIFTIKPVFISENATRQRIGGTLSRFYYMFGDHEKANGRILWCFSFSINTLILMSKLVCRNTSLLTLSI